MSKVIAERRDAARQAQATGKQDAPDAAAK
jgi:hypothetical protein